MFRHGLMVGAGMLNTPSRLINQRRNGDTDIKNELMDTAGEERVG